MPVRNDYGDPVMRSASFAVFLSLAQLFAAAPCAASAFDGDGSSRDHAAISTNNGTPYSPANASSASSTGGLVAWAAPSASISLLPLVVEATPFALETIVLPSGFPSGVERPPKPAL